jgi:hypothetical protein
MKKIVVSLDTAKELKEVGFPQETYFSYSHRNHSMESPIDLREGKGYAVTYAAPTADEVLRELPAKIKDFDLKIGKGESQGYAVFYLNKDNEVLTKNFFYYTTVAEGVAKMYLALKYGKLI